MSPISILLLIGIPSAIGTILAAALLRMIRQHRRKRRSWRIDEFCLVLETDIVISCGMALIIQCGIAMASLSFTALAETPLPNPVTYTIARVTGMFVLASTVAMVVFVLRRVLWRLGRHPSQSQPQGTLTPHT